ncbi:MAG TPA: transcription-repair coupling factor [Bacteroidota bacterium]|nr:transcription-repair coupling factor [Bacteroidota bacterium]
MIEEIRARIEELDAFKLLLSSSGPAVTVRGFAGSLPSFITAGIRDRLACQVLYVAADQGVAEEVRDDLALLLGGDAVRFFTGSGSPHAHSVESGVGDVQALRSLAENPAAVVVTSHAGLATPLPPASALRRNAIQLAKGEPADFDALVRSLRQSGFEQKDFVEAHGDFSVRGGILDVYTYAGENPVRAEFAGDSIESIREFDPVSQRSIRELSAAAIVPDLFRPTGETAPDAPVAILDYLRENATVVLEEPDAMRAAFTPAREGRLTGELINELLALFRRISFEALPAGRAGAIDFGARHQTAFNGSIAALRADIAGLQREGYAIYCTSDTNAEIARLKDLLKSIPGGTPQEAEPAVALEGVRFGLDAFHGGFVLPGARLALYAEHQIFNRLKRRGRRRGPKFRGFTEREIQMLRRGDFVVHQDFGIGRYDGMKRISVGGAEQEVVKILYEGKDTLFVNLNFVGKLQKYSSREGHVPALSRLGSGEWDRLKARATKKVKDIARELIALYARRKRSDGFAFSPDSPWQKELEASFMYEDTFDQAKATLDVKKDMEEPHPMDRLICGDVGFGKTEVAVRAAFKAVLDGKQAAVLVPTTILAMQHFNTFRDRLARYGVHLEVLSRFRSKAEQQAVVRRLAEGSIDIVIGTHRVLSRDVTFRAIGLLIIDEEHRFGVAAKEKIRQMKAEVDTLSLTATPIPRTLHFSLMGARDLSVIATPPRNRLPVMTEILQWNDDIIADAVTRELRRGGQVYFVHDRVQTMDDLVARLRRILGSARLRSAHGQMPAHELEAVMMSFLEKECDVLVATKIIESGLDIPNVNTIFINRADRFGMAELYQLRGRVGRSNVQAYAFLITPPPGALPRQTVRRLQAVEEFTELGSGFNLAMRDLEIRGAGNLLGAEQSGFIENMGFETYTRVLEEAVRELKEEEFAELPGPGGALPPAARETLVETDLDAFIPEAYMASDAERLAVYRRLYALSSPEQLEEVRAELEDRFGKFPVEIHNLMGMVNLRLAAARIGFRKVSLSGDALEAEFPPESDAGFYAGETFAHIMSTVPLLKKERAALRQEGKRLTLTVKLSQIEGDRIASAIHLLEKISRPV